MIFSFYNKSNASLKNVPYFLMFFSFWMLSGCASSGSLGGGPRDTTPPKLNEALSSPNFQLNSTQKKFEFLFNEFIEIKDPVKEVLVSPPFLYIPKVVSRGKKMILEINEKEELKEQTTYVVNFGNAIVDLNEANPLKNFRLVFSTGNQIDSLKIEGEVKDKETGKAASDITILVYDDLSDSILIRQKPFYTARTDNNGKFIIENVKSDTFRIFAIKDENRSYTYNQGTEMLGFYDSLVVFQDTQKIFYCTLEISKPLADYRIFESDTKSYGVVKQKWNTPVYSKLEIKSADTTTTVYHYVERDSVKIFYITDKDSMVLDFGFDTLHFRTPDMKSKPSSLLVRESSLSTFISVADSVHLTTNLPIGSIDHTKIILKDTSGQNIPFKYTKTGDFRISVYPSGQGFAAALLSLKKGAITDIFGNESDTNTYSYTIIPTEKLSELSMNVTELDSNQYYTFVFKDKNDKTIVTYHVSDKTNMTINLAYLKPDEYTLEIIEDSNKNGRWDPVNWWKKTQAEKIKKIKIEGLKENWALDKEIKYGSLSDN